MTLRQAGAVLIAHRKSAGTWLSNAAHPPRLLRGRAGLKEGLVLARLSDFINKIIDELHQSNLTQLTIRIDYCEKTAADQRSMT